MLYTIQSSYETDGWTASSFLSCLSEAICPMTFLFTCFNIRDFDFLVDKC